MSPADERQGRGLDQFNAFQQRIVDLLIGVFTIGVISGAGVTWILERI